MPRPTRLRGRRKVVFFTAWLMLPLVVFGLLIFWIVLSFRNPPEKLPPVGAGAGDAGGANAIGQMLEERSERSAQRASEDDQPDPQPDPEQEPEPDPDGAEGTQP